MSWEELTQSFRDNLCYFQGRHPATATVNDYYLAAAYTVRERLVERWLRSIEATYLTDAKVVCYLSAEFPTGSHLGNNLINLGIIDQAALGIKEIGLELETLLEHEPEPGLGNGGLGRLAACYIDSLATLEVPAIGYGIRYEFGIFNQGVRDGWQVEYTDKWLQLGNPWEIGRPELSVEVRLGGQTEGYVDEKGHFRVRWIADRAVRGIPYDTPILGYKVNTCNILRLWKAEACESFDFQSFNVGDYYGAVDEKVASENITKGPLSQR